MTSETTKSTPKRKRKPIVVEEHGVHVRLFKRRGHWWLDARYGTARERVSAKTTERSTAEARALELAETIARRTLLGVTPDTLTLAQLFAAYSEHKGTRLEGQWRKATATRQRLFLKAWGANMLVAAISQSSVDEYCAIRRRDYLAKQKRAWEKLGANGPAPEFRPLRAGGLDCDFRWLSSALNFATKHRLADAKRLLSFNPLHDTKWPREKRENIRRPIASADRYTRTRDVADEIDPVGRLRLALALARFTARRVDSILHLKASDLLLTADRIRAALADAGKDERLVSKWKHGAIVWRLETDKMGVHRIAPMSAEARAEIDRYLGANPRVGESWLFEHTVKVKDQDIPLTRNVANRWLRAAEALAELPKLRGGLWHPYRRLWATSRKHLPDKDVAAAGGWDSEKTLKIAYQFDDDDGVLAAVNL